MTRDVRTVAAVPFTMQYPMDAVPVGGFRRKPGIKTTDAIGVRGVRCTPESASSRHGAEGPGQAAAGGCADERRPAPSVGPAVLRGAGPGAGPGGAVGLCAVGPCA